MSIPVTFVTSRRIDRSLAGAKEDFFDAYQKAGEVDRRSKTSVFSDRRFITTSNKFQAMAVNRFEDALFDGVYIVIFYALVCVPDAIDEPDSKKRAEMMAQRLREGKPGEGFDTIWPTVRRLIQRDTPLTLIYHPGEPYPNADEINALFHQHSLASFETAEEKLHQLYGDNPEILQRVRFVREPKIPLEKAALKAHKILKELDA